ncbi:MAG: hypothetical protein JWO43_445 [Candidatus Adlerbacteria bacterium]|nr:hypothetical protein [Candidatus Adlerbacteria bacterium]
MPLKGQLTRVVTKAECSWLKKDLPKGKVVYEYGKATYGCVGPNGVAVSDKPNKEPFYQLPKDALPAEFSR